MTQRTSPAAQFKVSHMENVWPYGRKPAPQPAQDEHVPAGENHLDQVLDEALEESFPASDPIAIIISKPPPKPVRPSP